MARDLRFAVARPYGDGPVKICCPWHDDVSPSMAVYHSHAFCFGCRRHAQPEELLTALGKTWESLPELDAGALARLAAPPAEVNPALVAAWHASLVDPRSPLFQRLGWLRQRGLHLATIAAQRLGHDGKYFTLPVWDSETKALIGIRQRRDDVYGDPDWDPKYTQPRGQPALLYRPHPTGRYQVIVEGEFDALLLGQLGVDAMTTTAGASSLARQFTGLRSAYPVLVLTDMDDSGEDAYQALRQVVRCPLRRVTWRGAKDVSELLGPLPEAERASLVRSWFSG